MKLATNWERLAIEGVVIVVSILLAFTIEAWWDESQRRAAELEELSRLQDELIENVAAINRRYQEDSRYTRIIRTTTRLIDQIEAALENGERSILISVPDAGNLLEIGTLELDTPVLDSLINSGRLEIIEDQRIIELLGIWERSYEGVLETQRDGREFSLDVLYPAISARANLRSLLVDGVPYLNTEYFDTEEKIELQLDEELGNLIARRHFWVELGRVQWYRVLPEAEEAIAEIGNRIAQ